MPPAPTGVSGRRRRHGTSLAPGCDGHSITSSAGSLWHDEPEAPVTAFAVLFSLFVVVTLVLIVLTVRFTLQRAAASRTRWLEGVEGGSHEEEEEDKGMTALVLGGGGPRGAVQIGMLQVLAEHGFVPDRIYGCSVGAVNGVGFACDPSVEGVERMTQIWTGINREHVFPQGRLHGPWLYFQQRESVYSNSGLRKIVEDGITYERLEDIPVPVEVVATSLTDGRERWFTYGPAAEAVLASAAMPAIFPPIEIEGERYIDGGVVNNVPIRRAIEAGATRIVVLLCNSPVYTPGTSRRPIEAVINALFVSIHARFPRDMAQLPEGVEVILCVGSEDATRDFDDFSTTEALIAHGREEASEVVRRYGLGRKARPVPAVPVPAVPAPTEDGHHPGSPNGQSATRSEGSGAEAVAAEEVSSQPEPRT
jgi:NTE family protein